MSALAVVSLIVGILMCLVPLLQVRRIHQLKDSRAVSPVVFAVFLAGSLVWFAHGLEMNDAVLIYSELVGAFSNAAAIAVIWKYRKGPQQSVAPGGLRVQEARV
jgi:uncharacterized protein with PQ loop repeat